MEPSNNIRSILGNRLLEFALPPSVVAIAVAYALRAFGTGWDIAAGFMFISFVIAFRKNYGKRHPPQ